MKSPKTWSLGRYERLSWIFLMGALCLLAVRSQAMDQLIVLVIALLNGAVLYISPRARKKHGRALRLGVILGDVIWLSYRLSGDLGLTQGIQLMIELIGLSLPLTLLNRDVARSYWLSILNVTVIAIGCMAFGTSWDTFFWFILLVMTLIVSMNAANLYFGAVESGASVDRERLPPRYFLVILQALPGGLITAALIFFLFPRAQHFSFGLGMRGDVTRTGYAGAIDLTSTGSIERSRQLAFLVDSKDQMWLEEKGPSLFFRGKTLEFFDGRHWLSVNAADRVLENGAFVTKEVASLGPRREVTLHMEPSTHLQLFYPGTLVRLLKVPPQLGRVLMAQDQSLTHTIDWPKPYSYSVLVTSDNPWGTGSPSRGQTSPRPKFEPFGLSQLTQIPKDLSRSPWFRNWVEEVGISPKASPQEILQTVQAYFERGYTHSLEAGLDADRPLEDFLTQKRQGHCEYFATATALLLRHHGLPTRIVVGYRGGQWNRLIGSLEVREENAHAWTEVWLPQRGFVTFDTTPTIVEPQGLMGSLLTIRQALLYVMRKYLVQYDENTQRELLLLVKSSVTKGSPWTWITDGIQREGLKVWLAKERPTLLGLSVALLLAAGLIFYRRKGSSSRSPQWPDYYRRFLRAVEKKGFRPNAGETLKTFHDRLLASGQFDSAMSQRISMVYAQLEKDLYGES